MKCADCKWWESETRYRYQSLDNDFIFSYCRRYPKRTETREDYYCGEFSEKETTN